MIIRQATPVDIDRIMELIASCIRDMTSRGIRQWGEDYPDEAVFREDIRSGSLYLAEGEALCGVVALNDLQSPEYQGLPWSYDGGRVLVIHRLAVDPTSQGRGIGGRLVDFAEDFGRKNGYGSVRLDAYSGNLKALALYERRGYRKVGEVRFPRRELPFYCYEKKLDEPTPEGE